MSALAVAAAGGNRASCAGRVCAEDQGGSKKKRGEKNEPEQCATQASLEREGRDHGGSVLAVREKTDGAEGLGGSGQRF